MNKVQSLESFLVMLCLLLLSQQLVCEVETIVYDTIRLDLFYIPNMSHSVLY